MYIDIDFLIFFVRYNLIFFLITYMTPMVYMAFCYVKMGKHIKIVNIWNHLLSWSGKNLWRDTPGEVTESTIKCRKNKRKIVKMFAVIISVFGVCWLPYHVYFLYAYHEPEIMRFPHIKNIYLGFYWLAMANCALNPIVSSLLPLTRFKLNLYKPILQIYYWMGNRFRKYFNQLIFFRCFKKRNIDGPVDHFVQDGCLREDPIPLTSFKSPSVLSRRSQSFYLRNVSICKKRKHIILWYAIMHIECILCST